MSMFHFLAKKCGDGGIRTLGQDFSQHSISNRAPSATRTHLLITNHRNKQILQCKEQSEVTERFELSVGSPTTVFKTVALNRSATSPKNTPLN